MRERPGAPVVAMYELCDWLERKGIKQTEPMNKGGSLEDRGAARVDDRRTPQQRVRR